MKRLVRFLARLFNRFILIAAVVIIVGVIFMYTYPFNVAEFKKINILNTVQAGSQIKYNVDYCRYVGKGVEIYTRRFLVPKDEKLTNPIELSSSPALETLDGITGCRVSKDINLPVELSVPEGEYKLLIQTRYCIFIGRCIPVEGYSDYFTILKPNISDRISILTEELQDIKAYIQSHPEEVTSLGNTRQSTTPPAPNTPTTPSTPQPQPQAIPQSQSELSVLKPVVDTARSGIDRLFKIIGGQ